MRFIRHCPHHIGQDRGLRSTQLAYVKYATSLDVATLDLCLIEPVA